MKPVQENHFTGFGRYVPQFRILREAARARGYRKVMIFGASVGLEAFELSAMMPDTKIVSFELKPELVRVSRRYSALDERAEFLVSNWKSIEMRAPYDVICANSVLCDHPAANSKTELDTFPFENFSALVHRFAELLSPGGCLVICNTNYSVVDIAEDLDLHPATGTRTFQGVTSLFGPKSQKIIDCVSGMGQYPCYFSTSSNLDKDWDRLTSSVFFRSDPFDFPVLDLSAHSEIARIDPYLGYTRTNPRTGERPVPYHVLVRRDFSENGIWLEYQNHTGDAFCQIPLKY